MRIEQHPNRPYPPPPSPWVMAMTWRDLLFLHWPVGPEKLRPFIPPGLELEMFDGSAWLGVVPFEMVGTRARGMPPVPGVSRFPELNVRTYVRAVASGRPGVWFFSLDADQRLAVATARRSYHLAYMNARMNIRREGEDVRYESERTGPNTELAYGPTASRDGRFRGRYGPAGPACTAAPGTLERFFTDRYCLYAWGGERRLYRAEIHHEPWPLRPARADIAENTMAAAIGLPALGEPAQRHYVKEMKVVAWWPRRES